MNTLIYPLLLAIPLWALARWLRVYPRTALVWLALAACIVSIGLIFGWEQLFWPLWIFDAVLIAVAALDALTLPRKKHFHAERHVGRIASLAKTHSVTLTVANASRRRRTLWVRDDVAEELRADPEEFELRLGRLSRATLRYELRPGHRGAFSMRVVFLRIHSLLGLWQRLIEIPVLSTIHVYPDMKQLSEYAVLARTNRLSLMGVRRTRRIGVDNEFERLRDYTLDDNYKHIDWRSTARRRKLTVKDFQANQSQRILFLVDCGRMMTNDAAGVSLLDHAFNAMLMLSFVALRQGDSVGMLMFSDAVHGYLPPEGGMSQMKRLLHVSFDQRPRLVESRYDLAFLYLAAHCRKRALVVLITSLIDEVNAHQVEQYLKHLVGRHLPLGVILRDHRLFEAVEAAQPAGKELYRAAAAADILLWRNQVLSDLAQAGVLAIDVFPEELTAPLVNRYLDIKARHLL